MTMTFGPRRGEFVHINPQRPNETSALNDSDLEIFELYDTIYRSLCAALYNFAPLSGHPGGSISSGRCVAAVLFDAMRYDISDPDREDADMISYAAGHKALGLYAHWALRDEIIRIAAPGMLPKDTRFRLRLEDLLGFRRNPVHNTPLFKKFKSKPLDGHPTPATPFLRLSTGASGVGVASSIGLGFGAADYYGKNAPVVHIVEGEGGMTPGRVGEALAAAGTASLKNIIMHIDWNQASIDSNAVCRDGSKPGDYVQWDPAELCYLHDWNVILVEDGKDFRQIFAAQKKALEFTNSQPVAIVYKTIKGWKYGIEGKKSHGAGHPLCSAGFYEAIKPVIDLAGQKIDLCTDVHRCKAGTDAAVVEQCFWDAMLTIRQVLEKNTSLTTSFAKRLAASVEQLNRLNRVKRNNGPELSAAWSFAKKYSGKIPKELSLSAGTSTTLRNELGRVLRYYNKISNGSIFTSAADLLGSTSVNIIGQDFPEGYYHADKNPGSRTLSIGGICEDAMAGIMSGLSSYGKHIGVCASYGAFIAALGHIAARLHAIGGQARHAIKKEPYDPFFLVCAHAGIKTGEDGPTHADPQPLQLVQENFPKGTCITLTPWDPCEIWYLVSEALAKRPAVICPFVTRPNEKIIDRAASGLAREKESMNGVYMLMKPRTKKPDAYVVLQGSEVAYAFVEEALPLLIKNNIDVAAYYIASAELFDMLPEKEQQEIFPEEIGQKAMGITGFTLPTMYRWILSSQGRKHTLYPFKKGHFLGSGKAESVIAEAGLDGESQYNVIVKYIKSK